MVEVAVKAVGERPGRPPMVRLFVDLTASNRASSSRWLLIPRKLPADAGGVFKNEQQTAGSVVYGAFLGKGGFHAFLLAPGAKVTIKNLELGWWNDDRAGSPPTLEVRIGTASPSPAPTSRPGSTGIPQYPEPPRSTPGRRSTRTATSPPPARTST